MSKQPSNGHESPVVVPDRFSIWFSRAMQVGGLVIVGYETRFEHSDRPWLLLVAVAMMLGGIGLRLLVRGALRLVAEGEERGGP